MMKKEYYLDGYLKQFCGYLILFVLIPYIMSLSKDTFAGLSFAWLLVVNPLLTFINGLINAYRDKWQPIEALVPMIAFLFAVILIYNSSALIYSLVYGIVYLLGSGAGAWLCLQKNK